MKNFKNFCFYILAIGFTFCLISCEKEQEISKTEIQANENQVGPVVGEHASQTQRISLRDNGCNPPCVFYNNSEPEDVGVFDRELSGGDAVDAWTHTFTPIAATEVFVEIPERYSDFVASTISFDGGAEISFVTNGFALCGEVVQTFYFSGAAASFANDGQINIVFKENGDDISFDYARITISNSSTTIVSLVGDVDCYGYGEEENPDSDNDGVLDTDDNCPTVANPGQENYDGDSEGDACDDDDDNDGVLDVNDNCQFTANSGQENYDGDSEGDACDNDDDNDGVLDVNDNCQFTVNPGQENCDGDSEGDACDADDDNDGIADEGDAHPCSNSDATVNIDGCDSGVGNVQISGGSNMMDLIGDCAANATNHGEFVSCVAHLTNAWKAAGIISGAQKGAIMDCAAGANIP
jgi:Thrombospondin type 3 repeat